MNMKVKFFILPLIALLVYTLGAFFLVFAPAGIYLSPGEETLSGDNSLVISVVFLALTLVILLFVFIRKGGEKDERKTI